MSEGYFMCRKIVLRMIVVALSFYGFAKCRGEMPVSVTLKKRMEGQSHQSVVSLELKNRQDYPVWFIMGFFGNELLKFDGRFSAEYRGERRVLSAEEYARGDGRMVIVKSFGKDHFGAFLLPARATNRFEDFVFTSNDPLRFVDVWECKSIKINGELEVEKWFPFDVSCTKTALIRDTLNSGNQTVLDFKNRTSSDPKPYPSIRVETIVADPVSRVVVPIVD